MATTLVERTGGPAVSITTDRDQGLLSAAGIKGPCYVATTANITLAGLQTIDGVAVTAGKRVLVKDQIIGSQNGILIAGTGDWVRAPDFYSNDSVREGTQIRVTDGATNGTTDFAITTADPISIGTTSITITSTAPAASAATVSGAINSATDADFADTDYLLARASGGSLVKRSWANVKVQIRTALGALIAGMTAKTTPADADTFVIADSAASDASKKITFANLKASAANFLANANGLLLSVANVWSAAVPVPLGASLTGSLAIDFGTFINGYGTATGNITFNTATNLKYQSGQIDITASGADRTVSFNTSNYCTPNNASLGTITSGTTVSFSYARVSTGKVMLVRLGTI